MAIMDIAGALVTGIFSGGATGLLGLLLKNWFDFKASQTKLKELQLLNENALAMRKLELDSSERMATRMAQAEEHKAEMILAGTEAEAASRDFVASHDSDRATYLAPDAQKKNKFAIVMMAIADFARGMLRPVGTMYLMFVTTYMFWWSTKIAAEYGIKMSADQVMQIQMQIMGTVSYCFTTSWIWWFGVRADQKAGK
jgi:hypothetical protein